VFGVDCGVMSVVFKVRLDTVYEIGDYLAVYLVPRLQPCPKIKVKVDEMMAPQKM
jgi:hypothetical protein